LRLDTGLVVVVSMLGASEKRHRVAPCGSAVATPKAVVGLTT
jgi:hypothetical protein